MNEVLIYVPAEWAKFVAQAACDTGLNVYTMPADENEVALWTTETCSLLPFWKRLRILRVENRDE